MNYGSIASTSRSVQAGYDTINSFHHFTIPGSFSSSATGVNSTFTLGSNVNVTGRWAFQVDSGVRGCQFNEQCQNELPYFRVEGKNEHLGSTRVSWTGLVKVFVYNETIELVKRTTGKAKVNGNFVATPFSLNQDRVQVYQSGMSMIVSTDFGLMVAYDRTYYLRISLPYTYQNATCGLCGNFNNQPGDDLRTREGEIVSSDVVFANSWRASGDDDPGCEAQCEGLECAGCNAAQTALYSNDEHCGILQNSSGPFAACHQTLSPQNFVDSCVYDQCVGGGYQPFLCQAIGVYAGYDTINSFHHFTLPGSFSSSATGVNSTFTLGSNVNVTGRWAFQVDSGVRGCQFNGEPVQLGDSFWSDSTCAQKCTCTRAGLQCSNQPCSFSQVCMPDSFQFSCQTVQRRTCTVSGDPHYYTFDDTVFHFQGTCTYVLSEQCQNELPYFRVEGKNEHLGSTRVSWTGLVKVFVYNETIELVKRTTGKAKVNGNFVATPFSLNQDRVQVYQSGMSMIVSTDFGLMVAYDRTYYLRISLPYTYQNATCGLCGNFNNQPGDDLRTREGEIVSSDVVFANSWRASGDDDPGCEAQCEGLECAGCNAAQTALYSNDEHCGILQNSSGPFAACHQTLSPQNFVDSCVYDQCVGGGYQPFLCQAIGVYSNGTHFIYENTIQSETAPSETLISRQKKIKLCFSCAYPLSQAQSMDVGINPVERCPNPEDGTVELIQSGVSTVAQFSFRMFTFKNFSSIFVHCNVHLCLLNSSDCTPQCDSDHRRFKRDLSHYDHQPLSLGPVDMKKYDRRIKPSSAPGQLTSVLTVIKTTAQAVLISGGQNSFVLMNYGIIASTSRKVQAGYDTINSEHHYTLPGSFSSAATGSNSNFRLSSNVNVPGRWAFRTHNGTTGCTFNGEPVQLGDSFWSDSSCAQKCTCTRAGLQCSNQPCSFSQVCMPDSFQFSCQSVQRRTCTVSGDPHYYTFDNKVFHFQGTCTYVLSEQCQNELPYFRVEAKNEHLGSTRVSWTGLVKVFVYNETIELVKRTTGKAKVNGSFVATPFSLNQDRVQVYQSGMSMIVSTDFGLMVAYDRTYYLRISLPYTYQNATCGLCGNFNDNPGDDLRTREGEVVSSDVVFANSWQSNGTHFIYENSVQGDVDPHNSIITHEKSFHLLFSCAYPVAQALSMDVAINSLESIVNKRLPSGEGHYSLRMIPYEDPNFQSPLNRNRNLEMEINQRLYIEVLTEGVDERQISTILDSCWATPFNDANYPVRWDLINHECPNQADGTVELVQNGISTAARFSFKMFTFTNYSSIYLHCQVHLCLLRHSNCTAHCYPGHHTRVARDVSHHDTAAITIGPLHTAPGERRMKSSCPDLPAPLVILIVSLIFAKTLI
ncbi:IgGFc-binding protein [Oryzias melastigma]|uniref:IgGFc-binding protein n=1 Tax=Oryzias melastigma TaxID=30732 RepID=A0A834CR06_ORYME|nr:IgGFc-binding protein [Oryzias melastigma]